ncbi:GntR family transcriptional regulator [Mycolicibacillus koreensis]|nr:GntR family transcriptional regulator [Mycolicibacillus koreensis]
MNQSSPLVPPERQRVDEQIAASIVDAVLDGTFPAGSVLPPERDLATHLGVNRTSLRQALARLQQMGLIETRHGSGNVVADPATLTHPVIVEGLMRRLGPDFLVEMLELRTAFGALIGRLAAERGQQPMLEQLPAALAEVSVAGSAALRQEAELGFFDVLIQATGNRALALLYRWVQQAFGGREHQLTAAYRDGDAVVAGLTRIVAAVTSHDPDAAATAVEQYARDSALRMIAAAQRHG